MVRICDETPVLIDFGLSKHYDTTGRQTTMTISGISHGFAPLEQYKDGGLSSFSPQSDVYSLAATLYFLLSGIIPPPIDLLDNSLDFGKIPFKVKSAVERPIAKAMSLSRGDRHKSINDFLAELPHVVPQPNQEFASPGVEDNRTEIVTPNFEEEIYDKLMSTADFCSTVIVNGLDGEEEDQDIMRRIISDEDDDFPVLYDSPTKM